ncbi:MAG TPA: tetratricopeptide repeat protein [Balneolaceae bacterium]|nr:tetratricopeptide repeat protein [Balneolaceae bacterium]
MKTHKSKISQLAKNVQQDPSDTFSKFALALELLKEDQVEKAQLLFEAILKQDPDYLGVYYHLGKLYQRREMYNLAEEMFTKGIQVANKKSESRTKSELSEALLQLQFEIEE